MRHGLLVKTDMFISTRSIRSKLLCLVQIHISAVIRISLFHRKEDIRMFRKTMRTISLGMLVIAVIFVICALSNPGLGSVFYIGSFRVGINLVHWNHVSFLKVKNNFYLMYID